MFRSSIDCGSYYANIRDLETDPPLVEPAFQSLVNEAKSANDYYNIFDLYGLHFPTEMVLGARFGTTQHIKSSSFVYNHETEKGLNLEFGLEAEMRMRYPGLSRSAEFALPDLKRMHPSRYFKELQKFSLGRQLVKGGVDQWKTDMRLEPVPVGFSLTHLCKHPAFANNRSACEAAWGSYCPEHLQRLHPELVCGTSEETECLWDIDCESERCEVNVCLKNGKNCVVDADCGPDSLGCEYQECVKKPECVVTLFDQEGTKGLKKIIAGNFWMENQDFHYVDLSNIHWQDRVRSMSISSGCAKVKLLPATEKSHEELYEWINSGGNFQKDVDSFLHRDAKYLQIYPKKWHGEKTVEQQ